MAIKFWKPGKLPAKAYEDRKMDKAQNHASVSYGNLPAIVILKQTLLDGDLCC